MSIIKKRISALLLVLVLVFSFASVSVAAAPVFLDTEKHPYQKQIDLVTDLGFIFYYEKPYYSPDMVVTRDIAAETIYILVNGSLNEVEGIDYSIPIPDVRDSNYPVYYCRDTGIATDFDDGAFRPNDPVTYGQFVKMLIISLGFDKEKNLSSSKDYLSLAKLKGLTDGINLNEANLLTNGTAALLIYNSIHIPAFGEDGKQTLLDTTFQDLWKTTQSLNLALSEMEKMGSAAENGKEPDSAIIYDTLNKISGDYSEIYDNNINAAYKYDLRLAKFHDLFEVTDALADLENELDELAAETAWADREEIEYIKEELSAWDAAEDAYYQDIADHQYTPLLKKLRDRQKELLTQKLELLQASLPTKKDLQAGLAELEKWMLDSLYSEKPEKSPTGIVFESNEDFMNLVSSKYWDLYSLYSDLYDDGVFTDEAYEERIDELYYLITGSIYVEVLAEYAGEEGLGETELAEAAQYIIETLTEEVEFIHYSEHAQYLIDKLIKEYLVEVD